MSHSIDVAVAILRNAGGHVLLCRRPAETRYGGRWEFPGGKLEPGESHLAALRRELREELDVEASEAMLLHRIEMRYADGGAFSVRFYLIDRWSGEPRNLASSELAWVSPEALETYDILEGSRDVCRMLLEPAGNSTEPDVSGPKN